MPDPLEMLAEWAELPAPMTLATADADGVPHARTVLVTTIDATSVRFHSSTPTTKTTDLAVNPHASGVFHWPDRGRQVVAQGTATELDAATSRAAYPTRPRQLQLVAWAYEELGPGLAAPDFAVTPGAVEEAFERAAADPRSAVMPPSWTTIRFVPTRLDFWQAGTASTPPSRTRFVAEAGTWRHFPVLP